MNPDVFRNALILTGPTASGKSRLGVELAVRLGAEILSMDSMAVYRGMDVGTAKPSSADRARVPHHLIDVLDPWESASVAWWLEEAVRCCQEVEARGKRVLVVGGTPLYLKALLCGLFDGPPADETVRQRLTGEADAEGNLGLHHRLAAVDPVSAARLHPNDVRRVIRALEVWELTGKPISAWQQQWRTPDGVPPATSAVPDRCLCLDVPRETLYNRIDARVHKMIDAELLEEARALRRLERPVSREARQALGYKELFDHLEGKMGLEEAIRQIQTRSRQFAKRQLTWFRHLPECRFVREELTFSLWGLTIE
jgi:tRNA dimethylallyltransferase